MLGLRFIKFQPNEYVLKYRNGKIVKEGPGISFYYYAPTTSIVVVPLGSVEAPFIFEEFTSDYQTITVQGQVSYRIAEQKKIAQLLNYTLDVRGKGYVSDDPEKLSQRIINIVKVQTKKHLASLQLKDAVKSSGTLALSIGDEIRENKEINALGVEVLGLSFLAILPNKETARALEAQAREEILKKADEAIYQRRNASIEQERRIKENELNTEIAVENKKKQIRETQMEAERAVQIKQNQLKEEQMNFEIALEDKKKELAENAQKIGELNISPDLLQSLVKGSK